MKKRTMVMVALMLAGAALLTGSREARAAESLPASQVLGSETAAMLQSTLSAMQDLLSIIKLRIGDTANPPAETEKAAWSSTLAAMSASLSQINATVATLEANALAAENAGTPVAVTPPAASAPVAIAPAAPSDQTTVQVPENESEETAAVSDQNKKGALWGVLALAAVVAGWLMWRGRTRDDDAAMASTATPAEPGSEGHPIT